MHDVPAMVQAQTRAYSRLIAKVHVLLLAIVLLSLSFAGVDDGDRAALSAAMYFYGALVAAIRFTAWRRAIARWKIAAELWAMIPFVTWAIWFTDRLSSPLLNAYLVIVVAGALTLGRRTAMLQLALIAACVALLSEALPGDLASIPAFAGSLLTQLTPLIVVAYVTSTFAADIRYWMARGKAGHELDPETGLPDLAGFVAAADRVFSRAARNATPVSLLAIDPGIPGEGGRGSLRANAGCIETVLRRGDLLGRRGDGGFVALLPETAADGARIVAGRVQEAISTTGAVAAIGVAEHAAGTDDLDALLARAELDLRHARN